MKPTQDRVRELLDYDPQTGIARLDEAREAYLAASQELHGEFAHG